MSDKKDLMEQIIEEDLLMEAESIRKEVESAGTEKMSAERKERIKKRLHQEIEAREEEKAYAHLSEEDKKALEIGKKMLKKQKSKGKVLAFAGKFKPCVAAMLVIVIMLTAGVTAMGGPEKAVQKIKIMVGDGEVAIIDTDDKNYVVDNEQEEEAYREIKDVFGVEPVRMLHRLENMSFIDFEIDEELQTATMLYDYNGNIIPYHISSHHTESSWGVEMEDNITEEYYIEHSQKGSILITEYELEDSKVKTYSTKYEHNGLEYYLAGVMKQEEFNFLVKNLIFY